VAGTTIAYGKKRAGFIEKKIMEMLNVSD